MEVTHEGSMTLYQRLLEDPPEGPMVPYKPLRPNVYTENGKDVVAIVRSDDRSRGIIEATSLLGGFGPIVEGLKGEFLIKPNCNTDDPYPRDTHPETVRVIAEGLIGAGVPAERIILGETSGRARGLPTRHTLKNLGMLGVAEELGMNFVRAGTAGTHPRFVTMIRQLVGERLGDAPERFGDAPERLVLGSEGPSHDVCPTDCCLYTPRRPDRPA